VLSDHDSCTAGKSRPCYLASGRESVSDENNASSFATFSGSRPASGVRGELIPCAFVGRGPELRHVPARSPKADIRVTDGAREQRRWKSPSQIRGFRRVHGPKNGFPRCMQGDKWEGSMPCLKRSLVRPVQ
jgi:hypothetical protein